MKKGHDHVKLGLEGPNLILGFHLTIYQNILAKLFLLPVAAQLFSDGEKHTPTIQWRDEVMNWPNHSSSNNCSSSLISSNLHWRMPLSSLTLFLNFSLHLFGFPLAPYSRFCSTGFNRRTAGFPGFGPVFAVFDRFFFHPVLWAYWTGH